MSFVECIHWLFNYFMLSMDKYQDSPVAVLASEEWRHWLEGIRVAICYVYRL